MSSIFLKTIDGFRQLLKPVGIVIGATLGFAMCVGLGYRAQYVDVHKTFTRFHPMIAPDSLYQPTLGEMLAIVRSRVTKDKIVVIVGGNSIFYGVGQAVEKLWSRRLGDKLGDNYRVINFACRGGGPTDGGALVPEALRDGYPKIIYVANTAPGQAPDAIGSDTYRFLFWDAYFKGKLTGWQPREDRLTDYRKAPTTKSQYIEMELEGKADRWLHFKDLWERFGYNHLFPVWNFYTPEITSFLKARRLYTDLENDFSTSPFERRYQPQFLQTEMKIVRNFSAGYYKQNENNQWAKVENEWNGFTKGVHAAFPDCLKNQTLICFSQNTPFYVNHLNGAAKTRH